MMVYPTPIAESFDRRQIGDLISSLLDGGSGSGGTTGNSGGGTTDDGSGTGSGGTTANGGGGTTYDAGGTSVNGGTTTPPISTTTPPTSTRQSTTLSNGATASVSTAAGSVAAGQSVVTQVSTVAGGQTVVIIRTTAGSSATAGASNSGSSSSSNGGLIGGVVGGVVGGLALITAIVLIFIVWRRRQSRTGHGWFLCFGQRPKRGNKDFDVDWPTFDPTLGAGAAGVANSGSRSGRGGMNDGYGGTLPDLDENEAYSSPIDMREVGSGGHDPYGEASYYGASGIGASAIGGTAGAMRSHSASYKGPSEEGHLRNGGWNPSSTGATTVGDIQSPVDDAAPTYDHLDPPEVREARAREQAEAQAQAIAAYNNSNSSPPQYQSSLGHYRMGSPSPPPPLNQQQQRPLSSHRLSTGTTHALASNNYFAEEVQDPDSGTLQQGQHHTLHLHNPDA